MLIAFDTSPGWVMVAGTTVSSPRHTGAAKVTRGQALRVVGCAPPVHNVVENAELVKSSPFVVRSENDIALFDSASIASSSFVNVTVPEVAPSEELAPLPGWYLNRRPFITTSVPLGSPPG